MTTSFCFFRKQNQPGELCLLAVLQSPNNPHCRRSCFRHRTSRANQTHHVVESPVVPATELESPSLVQVRNLELVLRIGWAKGFSYVIDAQGLFLAGSSHVPIGSYSGLLAVGGDAWSCVVARHRHNPISTYEWHSAGLARPLPPLYLPQDPLPPTAQTLWRATPHESRNDKCTSRSQIEECHTVGGGAFP